MLKLNVFKQLNYFFVRMAENCELLSIIKIHYVPTKNKKKFLKSLLKWHGEAQADFFLSAAFRQDV